jgi:NAD(P)H-flavin reductase
MSDSMMGVVAETANRAKGNPYLPMPARVERTFIETDDRMLKTLDLTLTRSEDRERFSFLPGQFCELSVFGKGEAPFGIASSPTETGLLRFTVNKAGVVTTGIHHLEAGDAVGLRGPLGNGYPIHLFHGKNLVLIGGGFAFTTLRALTAYLLDKKNRSRFGHITLIYGARSPGLLLYKEEWKAWERRSDLSVHLTVDKGDATWQGLEGFVPDVVGQVAPSSENTYAVICGPPMMIKFTLACLWQQNFQSDHVYMTLERRMKCGIGKCGRCNIGHLYVCKDGPVFSCADLEALPKDD